MTGFFDRHEALLSDAQAALVARGYWAPFQEIPSEKHYGEGSRAAGEAAFEALKGQPLDLPGHPESHRVGAEESPFGGALGVTYPAADPAALIAASRAAAPALAAASPKARVGALIEALVRLNAQSFLIGHANQHTTGQAFAMAFQAGGPHAQDRALEAVALAWQEMTRFPDRAVWEKPQGKAAPLRLEKHWTLVPLGVALTIGCNTFPTWNGYPGIFASLATGNPVIVKPHPRAILPLAISVRILREVFAEAGLPADAILLAADAPQAPITQALATDPAVRIIDYTGGQEFGRWLRENARQARLFSEEAGVNTVTILGAPDFAGMCDNLAFSLALYSGQMCTSPQTILIPEGGIDTDQGAMTPDQVAQGIADALDRLLADPARAGGVLGAIANPATRARLEDARAKGRAIRDGLPLLLADAGALADSECFGPVSFVIRTADADAAIAQATRLAREKGAITAALYDNDEDRIARAIPAYAAAGVNLSINLTGNIFVNQSAAFSDFHVTGANPAGNACLTDPAFVAPRFVRAMWRRQIT